MEQSKMPVRLLSDPGSSFWIRQCNYLFSPQLSFAIAILISISIAIPLELAQTAGSDLQLIEFVLLLI